MNGRVKVLKQLIGESLYAVDEYAVAEAIVLRASVRRTVPEPFRGSSRGRHDRGLRRLGQRRQFRLGS